MADTNPPRTIVNGTGTVSVRRRPSLLLMRLEARATEDTLELGVAKLKKQCEATSQWLKRLGAARVEVGEPHFADQARKDPMQAMRAAARALRRRPGGPPSDQRQRQLNVVLTATWDIEAMSAEEVLVLVDRLRFEAAEDTGAAEPAEELSPWASPEEQMREMLAQIQQPAADDGSPRFLFVARLEPGQLEKASAEAFSRARQSAEQLARAAGMRLGSLSTLNAIGVNGMAGMARPDKLMERQRCLGLLAGCAYDPADDEIVSEDPLPAEFTVSVTTSYHLE
jgi:hypothetical protein